MLAASWCQGDTLTFQIFAERVSRGPIGRVHRMWCVLVYYFCKYCK